MLSSMIVIGIGAIVMLLCFRMADSRPAYSIARELSYDKNREASVNFGHWEPIQRAISTKEMANMTSDYHPEFVVLSRCDYNSGYCRGNGDGQQHLRETKYEIVRVWFMDVKSDKLVYVDLKNHTECECSSYKSGEKRLWHKVLYHVEEEKEEDQSTNNSIDLKFGEVAAAVTQPLISLEVPSNPIMKSGAETSSANIIAQRLHLRTMLLLLLMFTYTSF